MKINDSLLHVLLFLHFLGLTVSWYAVSSIFNVYISRLPMQQCRVSV